MKRMRNSVKALIISLCVLVVVASTIVGVVLLTRKNPTPPPKEPSFNLTQDQKDLFAAITQESKNDADDRKVIVNEFDPTKIVDENGNSFNSENVKATYDGYFVVDDGDDSYLYVFAKDTQGEHKTINLFEQMKAENKIKNFAQITVNKLHGDYVAYSYVYVEGNVEYHAIEFAYFGDLDNISVVNRIVMQYDDNLLTYNEKLVYNVDISFVDEYYTYTIKYYDPMAMIVTGYQFGVSVYTTEFVNENTTASRFVSMNADYENFSKSLVISDDGKYYIYYLSNNQIKFVEYIAQTANLINFYEIGNNIIVEYAAPVANISDLKVTSVLVDAQNRYFDYNYTMFDIEKATFNTFNLSDGYSKIDSVSLSGNNYTVIKEVKVDENHQPLNDCLTTYYKQDLTKVISYLSKVDSKILYSNGVNVLTSDGIIRFKDNGEYDYVVNFKTLDNNYSIISGNITCDYFAIDGYNSISVVMKIDGTVLYEEYTLTRIFDYGNGIFAAYGEGKYYLFDAYNTNNYIPELSDIVIDENGVLKEMFLSGYGYSILSNEDETYSLASVNSKSVIYNNIKTFTASILDEKLSLSLNLNTSETKHITAYTKFHNYSKEFSSAYVNRGTRATASNYSLFQSEKNVDPYDDKLSTLNYDWGKIERHGDYNTQLTLTYNKGYYPADVIWLCFSTVGENHYIKIWGLSFTDQGRIPSLSVTGNMWCSYFDECYELLGNGEMSNTVYSIKWSINSIGTQTIVINAYPAVNGFNQKFGWETLEYASDKDDLKGKGKSDIYGYRTMFTKVKTYYAPESTTYADSISKSTYSWYNKSGSSYTHETYNMYSNHKKNISGGKHQNAVTKFYASSSGSIDQVNAATGTAAYNYFDGSNASDKVLYDNADLTSDNIKRYCYTFHQYHLYDPISYKIMYSLNISSQPGMEDYAEQIFAGKYPYTAWKTGSSDGYAFTISGYEYGKEYSGTYNADNTTINLNALPGIIAYPQARNYKCVGWATDGNSTEPETKYNAGTKVKNFATKDGDILRLYAVWEAEIVTYNLQYYDSSNYGYVRYELTYDTESEKWVDATTEVPTPATITTTNNLKDPNTVLATINDKKYIVYSNSSSLTTAVGSLDKSKTYYYLKSQKLDTVSSQFGVNVEDGLSTSSVIAFKFYYNPTYSLGSTLLNPARSAPKPRKQSGSDWVEDAAAHTLWQYAVTKDSVLLTGSSVEFTGQWVIEHADSSAYQGNYANVPVGMGADYAGTPLGDYYKEYASHQSGDVAALTSFTVKAVYATRKYEITIDSSKGQVFGSSNADYTIDKSGSTDATPLTNATLINNTAIVSKIGGTGHEKKNYLGNATINIVLDDFDETSSDNAAMHYIFEKIEISRVGYYSGGSYGYATITLTFKDNGTWDITCSNSSILTKIDNKFYIGNQVDSIRFNEFTISSTDPRKVTLQVNRLGIPGVMSGSTFSVTEASSTSGTVGFTITPFTKSNYTPDDTLSVVSDKSGSGTALELNAQVVRDGEVYINNVKYTIPSEQGFYKYDSSSKVFVKKSDDYLTAAGGWENGVIYHYKETTTRSYVYYASSYDYHTSYTQTNYSLNGKTINTNFNNTKIIAIRPEQHNIYASTGAGSTTKYSDASNKKFELSSYLSAIQVQLTNGGSTQNYIFKRNVKTVGNYKTYYDINMVSSSGTNQSDYVTESAETNVVIKYLGVDYKVYQYSKFTAGLDNSRNFVLYLTRNETTQEIMYFLYSDVFSTSIKSASSYANAATISFTFSRFQNEVSLDNSHSDTLFDDNDSPLVYRYAYSGASTNNTTYNTSGLTRNNSSGTSSKVAYFGQSAASATAYYKTSSTAFYMNPSDTIRFELQPTDGYIIKKITVSVGTDQLFNYDYKQSMITLQTDGQYSYTYLDTTNNRNETHFQYEASGTNKYFQVYKNNSDKAFTGVMYVNSNTTIDSRDNVWNSSSYTATAYFNPIWILVSGMYDNVSISVETMSYAEFYFEEDTASGSTDLLGHTGADNDGNLTKLTLLGKKLTVWQKIDLSDTSDGIHVKKVSAGRYRVVFEGEAAWLVNGIKISSSDVDYSNYFTKAKLYLDDTKQNSGDSVYTGRLFENILYTKADDVNGRTESDGSLYVNALVNSSGTVNQSISLENKEIKFNDKATYIYISDIRRISYHGEGAFGYITNTYTKSSSNYYSKTYESIQTHSGGLEYSNKYFMAFTVKKNAVKYTTNSYVYNDNLTQGEKEFEAIIQTNPTTKSVKIHNGEDIKPGMIAMIITKDGAAANSKILSVTEVSYNASEGMRTVTFSDTIGFYANTLSAQGYKLRYLNYEFNSKNYVGNVMQEYTTPDGTRAWKYTTDAGFACYQLDYIGKINGAAYSKEGSWFNDVVLTNYAFYDAKSTRTWQSNIKDAHENFKNEFEANGYSMSFTYYETPGYYLNYVEIKTVDFGSIYINIPSFKSKNGSFPASEQSVFASGGANVGFYYELSYNKTKGEFTIKLYDCNNNTGVQSGINSLGIISNNFAVNFYSYPYTYNIEYNDNTGISSSSSTLKRYYSNGTQKTDTSKQVIIYDTLSYLDLFLKMDGYTFIGWGSEKYYDTAGSEQSRYKSVSNTWDVSSSWIDVKDWFEEGKRADLLSYKEPDVKFYTKDFYVKSSFIEETNEISPISTGYFITDTGFATDRTGFMQNYNFWSVYAKQFIQTIGSYDPNNAGGKATFKMYGVWRANTYALQFNVYDSSVKNGSTEYKLDIKAPLDKATLSFYDDKFSNFGLSYNIENIDGSIATGATTYYCFIKFDTDDWYITDATTASVDTLYSYFNDAEGSVHKRWNNVLDENDKTNLVIDRYGYSWLGWFSKNETDIRNKTDVKKVNRIFGSEYYYGDTALKDFNSKVPLFNYSLYGSFRTNGTLHETYSKFIYNGQHKVDNTLAADSYVYFYKYNSGIKTFGTRSYQYNKDYLNEFESTSGKLTYFDTSLSYDCYSIVSGAVQVLRSLDKDMPEIRYLQLYSYWLVNYYEFILDWQDNTGNVSTSLNVLGSTTAGILNGTNVEKQSLAGAYFDDNELSNRLNNFTPVRVGYDFIGWAYYYRTANGAVQYIPVYQEADKADTALWLCKQLTTDYGIDPEYSYSIVPLYTSNECIKNNNFRLAQEAFGEESDKHYCYLFAIWKPQTFTINVDLNIDREELENLYEKDSNFAVALYNNILNNINIRTGIDYENYTGIRSNYYKLDANTYTEIVANVNFVITFDQDFTTAICEIPYKLNGVQYKDTFYLDNLFAVSTGYYLLGWLFDPNVNYGEEYESRMLVYNTLKSSFGIFGDLTAGNKQVQVSNVNSDGESYLSEHTNVTFNFDMYKKLYNTNFKERSNINSVKFYTDNEIKLSQIDAHGASTNFGYVEIAGKKAYIACDDDVDAGNHALYFKHNGLKYYIVLYYYKGDALHILTNDHSFLYCMIDGVKYKVRFDTFGQAYYVDTYFGATGSADKRVILDIRIAAFQTYSKAKLNVDAEGIATNGNISSAYNTFEYKGDVTKKYKFFYNGKADPDHYVENVGFVPKTTRQFTLYAHWHNKDDMYVNIKNGNNSEEEHYSNPGLAGYYNIITTTTDRVLGKYTSSFVDNDNVLTTDQFDTNLRLGYNYYDDVAMNILPYYNGRFLSELSLTFYGITENVLSVNEDNGKMKSKFTTSKYTLTFKFEWDNEKHIIKFRTEGGVVFKVDGADGRSYSYIVTESNGKWFALESMALGGSPIKELSLLDADIFSDYLFRVFEYSNGTGDNANFDDMNGTYGRLDTNKISINMENLMTNMDITCRFSVQTYDLKFYSVLDTEAYRLSLQAGTTNKYETGFNTYDEFQTNVTTNNSNPGDSGTFFSSSGFGSTNLATIPQDCAAALDLTQAQGFNVPYGYFIYGQFFTSAFAPNRPIDNTEPTNNVVEFLNTELYGFQYIYSNGYYDYGQTGYALEKNPTDLTDSYYAQCSPVLGPTYKFSQANGFRKLGLSFYTFAGWYEYDKTQNSKVVFVEYDRNSEATYIKRNIVLYGYYYPINTPTSIEFYTWNDENENYIQYTGNANQYTLNAEVESHPFYQQSNLLVWNTNNANYADDEGIAKIKNYNKYGVNSTEFGKSAFTVNDFQDQPGSLDATILEKVLQTYWFYDDSYMALYFMEGSTKHYIRYASGEGFYYYQNETGKTSKVNIDVYTEDMVNFKINGTNKVLQAEELYKYDFDGSYLYIKETANQNIAGDIDKYYRLYNVTDADIEKAGAGTYSSNPKENEFVRTYKPRYTYRMHGTRYFMLARDEQMTSRASNTIYHVSGNSVVIEQTANLTTVKNYFVKYAGEYYPVEYKTYTDAQGCEYISPMYDAKTNLVTVPVATGNVDCYFNYDTELLYNASTDKRVDFDHYMYCPINENYLVNTKCISGIWYTDAITIKSLPSPNIGFWYPGQDYGFVGYIMVTDKIIDDMKKAPSNDGTDQGGIIYRTFEKYLKVYYSKANFAKTMFADYDSGTGNSALYDAFIAQYAPDTGTFDDAYDTFFRELSNLVGEAISNYSKTDLLNNLLLAESYEYSKDGLQNIISGVNVNIPVSFKNIMTDPRTGSGLSTTVTVQTEEAFAMISINTSVETNIYAIPIYSPYILSYNSGSVSMSDSKNMVVDTSRMDVWHFELGSDSSYAYNKANGDLLNFVLLNSTQYESLYNAMKYNAEDAEVAGYLSSIIKNMTAEEKSKFIFTESADIADMTVDINLNGCENGHYVLVAYYNKSGITSEEEAYAVRVSDNVVHLQVATGGTTFDITTLSQLCTPVE